ncbi:MAG TPA: transposase [Nitrospiraceae bacterium]|nr:transposase [Nitrospiraceae bacterium]
MPRGPRKLWVTFGSRALTHYVWWRLSAPSVFQSPPTLNLCLFYNHRAGVELLIKQLKGDYALGSIPARHFFANETYVHPRSRRYNLVNWFKRLCLLQEFQNATLQTLRHHTLLMPARLRHTENRPRLALPASGFREAAWKYPLHQIKGLKL